MLPDWEALQHFHFLRPAWGLLAVPWLVILLLQGRRRARRDKFGGIIAPHLLEHLRLERRDPRWLNPRVVTAFIVVLTTVVGMGPTWRQQPSPLSRDESALVVLLDVSASMEQQDVQPSRLQRAKQKVSDLLALRPDKRSALVAYAGSAHTVLTLTADRDILGQYLDAITPAVMPRAGKFPEYALPLVDWILGRPATDANTAGADVGGAGGADARGDSPRAASTVPATVLLVTDGLGADSAAAFADYFRDSPHRLLVLGVGTEEAAEGGVPLERRALERLADGAGGDYVELTVNDRDVHVLNRAIDSHYVVVENSALPWLDSGYVLVFPAMALFLLWFRRGWTLTWGWLLLPLVLAGQPLPATAQDPGPTAQEQPPTDGRAETQASPLAVAGSWLADLWLTRDQQGRLLLQLGHYRMAAARFEDPMWKGLAHYYAEEFMTAAEYFSRRDSDIALFDEANARAHARDYLRALNRYDRLLARDPDFPGAAANRARVQEIVDEINRLSESQQQEPGVSGEDKELGGDDAIPAQGAEELSWEKAELKQLSAEEILQDPAIAQMWLRAVQQDPSRFLAIKFAMQLQGGAADEEAGQ